MRVIVAGAVAWTDAARIKHELEKLPAGSIVIHGDAPGADALAGHIAEELELVCQPFRKEKQDYQKYKRAAWKSLNERMLAAGADLVLAFHPAIDESRGTRHLVEIARVAGVEVRIITGE
jgi:YspA, cpYpsA-related SLOG family